MVKPQCVLALGTLAAASPPPSRNNCSPVTFKVSATAENLVFTNPPDPNNATQIITFFQQGLTLGIPTNGTKTVSSDFVINGVYCRPTANKGKHPRALQLLVHGVSYNSSYWSGLGFGEKYNWHSYANDQGYHTLAIDRPGHGKNSRNIDPLGVIQTPMEVDVLHKVISAIKAGARNGNDGLDKAFSDVIYIGHSFGSMLATQLARLHPLDASKFILTGYSTSTNLTVAAMAFSQLSPASLHSPSRFANVPLGYGVMTSATLREQAFYAGAYDKGIPPVDFAYEDIMTTGEMGSFPWMSQPAPGYAGDIFVISGDGDALFCPQEPAGTGCDQALERTRDMFPGHTGGFAKYVVGGKTGHCLGVHERAGEAVKAVHTWLEGR